MSTVKRSVVIVDDHAEFRPFVHALLEAEGGWQVIAEAGDCAQAIAVINALRPDVVLLDVQLPDGNGFDVADVLARDESPPAVVLMSSREASDYGDRLRDAPTRGFLPKRELSGVALAALAA